MKILLVDNSLDNTGASKALIKTIAEMPKEDLEFIFLFPRNSKCIQAAEQEGFRSFSLRFREISKRISDLFLYIPSLMVNSFRIRKLIKQHHIDLVHVNDIYNMLGLSTKLITKVKVLTHVRRMPESFPATIYRTWSRLHVRYADHIVAVSEANKKGLPPNNKTTVIYDPLPENEALPRYSAKATLNKQVRILYLANFTGGKGHMYALQVLEKAVKDFPGWNFELNFYGGDFGLDKNNLLKQSLIDYADAHRLSEFVNFNGKTSAIEQVMKSHDIVLNLSDSESFSRVTLEALFFGIPLVATDVGGTNEMVIEGVTGLLAKPFDVDDMYSTFKKILSDDSLRVSVGSQAYTFVREQFSNRETVVKLMDLYKSLNK